MIRFDCCQHSEAAFEFNANFVQKSTQLVYLSTDFDISKLKFSFFSVKVTINIMFVLYMLFFYNSTLLLFEFDEIDRFCRGINSI